jgi:hypothetical protein
VSTGVTTPLYALNVRLYVVKAEKENIDNAKSLDSIAAQYLDVLHIARCFIFIARLVAADRAHLIVVVVVLVGVFSGIPVGVLLYVFWSYLSAAICIRQLPSSIPLTLAS